MTASQWPEYGPVPEAALGPELNADGYFVERVQDNLFWVTDGTYQAAFLTTPEGVVLFDAPPTIGNNLRRAIDEITTTEDLPNQVTHLVYSHHHADHAGASYLFGDVTRVGHAETRRLLQRDNDRARPAPDVTFEDSYTLEVGGSRVELSYHGPNHSPDNIDILFPDHDTLMQIDIVNIGWVPLYNLNLSEDVPGYIDAADRAMEYSWTHYLSGHLGRLGTRPDVELHQRYIADIVDSANTALASVDPTPYFVRYGENAWGGVTGYLDAVTAEAAAPVIEKYTGVLAAADIPSLTTSTTFSILQSIRLDLGHGSQVHP
ncbi:MBL fold metallo-hydrolase [Kribbella sp. NPDC059898]|uniref:MBL fold metallo-hydrolase n=1 Tax=Kribbella sp. NPDC059898 TaxID=3346995 RepID=UPI0036634CC1